MYSQPAMMRLAKKKSPTMTKIRLMRSFENKLARSVKDFAPIAVAVSFSRPEISTLSTASTRLIKDMVYFRPGRPRMSTPISLNKKTERIIKINPEMAEVIIS